MLAKLLWSPKSLEDLMDIYVMIGLDSPDAAERVYSAIEARAEMLPGFPRLGPRRPDIGPTARMLVEGSYLVLYELHPDTDEGPTESVEIVRVVDGRRELSRLFQ